jgi:hypothetical protein
MQPDIIPGETATSGPTIPSVDVNADSILGGGLGDVSFAWFSLDGLLGFLGSVWAVYTILAYLVTIILLVLYVYASVRKNLYLGLQVQILRDAEKLYAEKYHKVARNDQLGDVLKHSESDNPNDWKLAIIEADIILDNLLKQKGYAGSSLGERLKSISPTQLESLNDAWEAHKIRNRIAHDGADFVLTKKIARETIARYQRVFMEFGLN